eukprot:6479848-Prymnesium_polylepis.4
MVRHDGGEKALVDEEGGTASMKAKETPIPPVNTSGTLLSAGVTMVPVPGSPGGPCVGSNLGALLVTFLVCACPARRGWPGNHLCRNGAAPSCEGPSEPPPGGRQVARPPLRSHNCHGERRLLPKRSRRPRTAPCHCDGALWSL